MKIPRYFKPRLPAEAELEIKKSKFIVNGMPISSAEQAREFILSLKSATPSANHHCSAFIIGAPSQSQMFGYHDDGEPSGTAGKPMYQVLEGQGIGDICVVVTRFFGGIKLGTGGLARAYADSVKALIPQLILDEVLPLSQLQIEYEYSLSSVVDSALHNSDAIVVDSQYTDRVMLRINIPVDQEENLSYRLNERCSGNIVIKRVNR